MRGSSFAALAHFLYPVAPSRRAGAAPGRRLRLRWARRGGAAAASCTRTARPGPAYRPVQVLNDACREGHPPRSRFGLGRAKLRAPVPRDERERLGDVLLRLGVASGPRNSDSMTRYTVSRAATEIASHSSRIRSSSTSQSLWRSTGRCEPQRPCLPQSESVTAAQFSALRTLPLPSKRGRALMRVGPFEARARRSRRRRARHSRTLALQDSTI